VLGWLALAAPAHAAFPGGNGMLAVQPLQGRGLILVRADGADAHRICNAISVCGHPGRPMFSPDGRSLVFAGPAIRLIGSDGSCENCQFGVAANPAFQPGGTLVTFAQGGRILEDAIDGIRRATVKTSASGLTDAVWSAGGTLAAVGRGRVLVGKPGHLRSIGTGGSPSWSANGTRLAFVRGGWIRVVTLSDRVTRRLARGTAPAFSPDGRWIAFIGSGHRLEVIGSRGGRARAVGEVRGRSVDWQPIARGAPACVPPPGATVIARSSQAIVTTETGPSASDGFLPDTAAMGCLIAVGRERLLEHSIFDSIDDATDYPLAAVGGTYAAVVAHNYDEHYGGATDTVNVFDLRTGAKSGFGGETGGCGDFGMGPSCAGIDQVLVGADGVSAVHVNGGPLGTGGDSLQVLCASTYLCLATNNWGEVLSSTSPMQGPWNPGTGVGANTVGAGGGSCPSVSLCVLVGDGSIYTSTDPSAGSWMTTHPAGSLALTAVDCPTTSLCVASTTSGQVAVSTDPTGGASAWSLEDVDGDNPMYGVSCPSSSECVATDIAGNVLTTTDPTGGPSAWNVRKVTPGMTHVSCPSTSLCVAEVGNSGVAVSTDPISGPWTTTPLSNVGELACPSNSLCMAAAGNSIGFSTDPASGNWTTDSVSEAAGYLRSMSCPTTSFCVAAGIDDGDALISTNPTGGPSSWTPVLADQVDCAIVTGACGTEQVIASDRTGVHALDKSTEFEAQTGPQLTGLTLDGATLSWEDGGSPRSAQLTP
jgi:hypothetical protein